MSAEYRYSLAITSQFPFCGIPFRLDSYSTCQFACRYCFASARGGATGRKQIQYAQPDQLRKRFERLAKRGPRSTLDEMLEARVPIHFGGMSDPFMPIECEKRTSLALLEILADHNYPTIISTKGTILRRDEYLRVLKRGKFAVQFSISSVDARLALALEKGTPTPAERLGALQDLANSGIATAVRLQPLLPTREIEAREVISLASHAGARHVSVEYLKLPVERTWSHRKKMDAAVGFDLTAYYSAKSARRVGREWVLPPLERLPTILALRLHARNVGLSFGAADNDFLHWSDGEVCCSGADLLGMGNGIQFNFTTAVRRGISSRIIRFSSIRSEWRPRRSISEFVNSHSRRKDGESIEAYIRDRWNGVANGPSPRSFFGVEPTGQTDSEGFAIYRLSDIGVPAP